jgi:hypothetical protein
MPNTLTRNPSDSDIEIAKKIHGTKAVLDALNELERLRSMAKLMIRASEGICSTYHLNDLSNQYARILTKYFGG